MTTANCRGASLRKDITGQKFGRLTATRIHSVTESGTCLWECFCECGGQAVTSVYSLQTGKCSSCGCFAKEQRFKSTKKHGDSLRTAPFFYLYQTWKGHIYHIREGTKGNIKNRGYANMPIQSEWNNTKKVESYLDFKNWVLENIGERPSSEYTLDIIKHSAGFTKGNLRWATFSEQMKNRRYFLTATTEDKLMSIFDEELIKEIERRHPNWELYKNHD